MNASDNSDDLSLNASRSSAAASSSSASSSHMVEDSLRMQQQHLPYRAGAARVAPRFPIFSSTAVPSRIDPFIRASGSTDDRQHTGEITAHAHPFPAFERAQLLSPFTTPVGSALDQAQPNAPGRHADIGRRAVGVARGDALDQPVYPRHPPGPPDLAEVGSGSSLLSAGVGSSGNPFQSTPTLQTGGYAYETLEMMSSYHGHQQQQQQQQAAQHRPMGQGQALPPPLYRPARAQQPNHYQRYPELQQSSRGGPGSGSPVLPTLFHTNPVNTAYHTPIMSSIFPSSMLPPTAAATAATSLSTPPNAASVTPSNNAPSSFENQYQRDRQFQIPQAPSRPNHSSNHVAAAASRNHRPRRMSDTFASPASSISPSSSTPHSFEMIGQTTNLNLDAAAIATERRIRELRATRGGLGSAADPEEAFASLGRPQQPPDYPAQPSQQQSPRRIVSFSQQPTFRIGTEVGGMGGNGADMVTPTHHNAAGANLNALFHPSFPAGAVAGRQQADISISLSSGNASSTSPFAKTSGLLSSLPRSNFISVFPASHSGAYQQSTVHPSADSLQSTFSLQNLQQEQRLGLQGDEIQIPEEELESPEEIQTRRWDGSLCKIPKWIVSETAEEDLDDYFVWCNVRFFPNPDNPVPSEYGQQNKAKEDSSASEQDLLLGILETHLGLKTFHGWYGYTYKNPKSKKNRNRKQWSDDVVAAEELHDETQNGIAADPNAANTRKRRRRSTTSSTSSSPASTCSKTSSPGELNGKTSARPSGAMDLDHGPQRKDPNEDDLVGTPTSAHSQVRNDNDEGHTDEEEDEEEEESFILIYDSFGRVRGTVPKMRYRSRGGPKNQPLPPPAETFALRNQASAVEALKKFNKLRRLEDKLIAETEISILSNTNTNTTDAAKRSKDDDMSTQQDKVEVEQTKTPSNDGTTIKSTHFYESIKQRRLKLSRFRSANRTNLLKSLQNSYLTSCSNADFRNSCQKPTYYRTTSMNGVSGNDDEDDGTSNDTGDGGGMGLIGLRTFEPSPSVTSLQS